MLHFLEQGLKLLDNIGIGKMDLLSSKRGVPEKDKKAGNGRPTLDFEDSDTDGHLFLPQNALVVDRYEVDQVIGCGTYGQVWKVKDIRENVPRAMKVSLREKKSDPESLCTLSSREVAILKDLNSLTRNHKGLIVQLLDCFEIAERVFIIMELLDISVFDFLYFNHFQPFPSDHAIHISYQLLSVVDFLHYNKYMHTDIKPENIVLVCADYDELPNPKWQEPMDSEDNPDNPEQSGRVFSKRTRKTIKVLKRTEIRLVDFGSAFSLEDRGVSRTGKIGTREYRSPESILRSWFHLTADIWSMGVTLVDIWLGITIMNNVKNDVQQLLRMETVFGPMPERFLKMAPVEFILARDKCMQEGYRGWEKPEDPIPPVFCPLPTRLFNYFNQEDEFQMQAFKLIHGFLQYEPVSRLTAEEALKDPLFNSLPRYLKL